MRTGVQRMATGLVVTALVLGLSGIAGAAEVTLDEALSRARNWAFSARRAELAEDGARLDEEFARDTSGLLEDQKDQLEEDIESKKDRRDELSDDIDELIEKIIMLEQRIGHLEAEANDGGTNEDEQNDGENEEEANNDNDDDNDELEDLLEELKEKQQELNTKQAEYTALVTELAMLEMEFDEDAWRRSIDRAEEDWEDRRMDLDHAVDDTRAVRALAEAQARRAYVEALVTKEQLGVESERLLNLEERKDRMETQIELGMQPETAIEELEAEERHIEANWYDLKGQLVVAKAYLNLSMGEPATTEIEVVPFSVRTRREMDVDEAREQFRADAQTIRHLEDRIDRLEEKIEAREDELEELAEEDNNDDPEDEMLIRELEYEIDQFELQVEMLELEMEEVKARADADLEEAYQDARALERQVETAEQDYRDGVRHLERLELQEELGVIASYEVEDYQLELKELEALHRQARYNYFLAVEEFFLEQEGLHSPVGEGTM